MKRIAAITVLTVLVALGGNVYAEGEAQTGDSQIVIEKAAEFSTLEERIAFLLERGEGFFDSQKYTEAKDVAEYILTKMDAQQEAAQDLWFKADQEIQK